MKKENLIIVVLVILAVALAFVAYREYNETNNLNEKISGLEDERSQLINERESLILENKDTMDKLFLLEQDVAKIYKTCINENACKGRYPGVSWYCNNVGDQAESITASHTCQCDVSCQLNATQIKNIN